MINEAQFRADLPEFANTTMFPTSSVNYWLNVAKLMINTCRFGESAVDPWPASNPPALTIYDIACEMFIAHNLVLEAIATRPTAVGGIPGLMTGVQSSKSVDKASVSYDTNIGLDPNAGHWNLTLFGVRFYELWMMHGAGPLHVGAAASPYPTFGNGGLWGF